MRHRQSTITPQDVGRHAAHLCQESLLLEGHGPKCRGCRFTVALRPVRKGDRPEAVLKDLLRQAARVGIKPRYLLLDRGFYSVGVIRYLSAARYCFLMPVVMRGRKVTDPRGPSGTRVFQTWKRRGWPHYTLSDAAG